MHTLLQENHFPKKTTVDPPTKPSSVADSKGHVRFQSKNIISIMPVCPSSICDIHSIGWLHWKVILLDLHSLRSTISISIFINILTLNKQKERQDKLIYTEIFMHNIQEVLLRIHKSVPTNKICTYCSMNKQYMKGI